MLPPPLPEKSSKKFNSAFFHKRKRSVSLTLGLNKLELAARSFVRLLIKIILTGALITLFFFLIYWIYDSFLIKEIEIEGLTEKRLIKGLELINNKNIFFIKEDEIAEKILNENPEFNKISLIKIYPRKVKLIIKVDKPLAALQVNGGFLILSSQGRIIAKSKKNDEHLPVINYYQKLDYYAETVGDWIKFKDITAALDLLKYSFDFGLAIDIIDINGLDMIGFKLGTREILFTTEKSVEVQKYELEKIMHQFKIEGKEFLKLDLRFDKPVVVFKN